MDIRMDPAKAHILALMCQGQPRTAPAPQTLTSQPSAPAAGPAPKSLSSTAPGQQQGQARLMAPPSLDDWEFEDEDDEGSESKRSPMLITADVLERVVRYCSVSELSQDAPSAACRWVDQHGAR